MGGLGAFSISAPEICARLGTADASRCMIVSDVLYAWCRHQEASVR